MPRCEAFRLSVRLPVLPDLGLLTLLVASLACSDRSLVSQSDVVVSVTMPSDADLPVQVVEKPPPTTVPEPSCDRPVPRPKPADTTVRIHDLHRTSTIYDFRLEVLPAKPQKGNEVQSPKGKLTIFRKGTTRVVQRLRLASLAMGASEPEYEPILLVNDFNFDGHEDFAIHKDDFGSYGSATYAVFLFVPAKRKFAHSRELSQLTELSLGAVEVDAARKRLLTASKSGCCKHWSEEYELHHGIPRLMKRETEEEASNGTCILTIETRRKDGGMRRKTEACR